MKLSPEQARQRRRVHIRKRVRGVAGRPRMCVFRSDRHIYVQIINDENGKVLASASSQSKEFRDQGLKGSGIAGAKAVGELIARRATAQAVEKVVFDRSGYVYHGRIKALADAARAQGLQF